ncbi:MAG: serine hydrolase [Elusimicrobia bacterium]|nr:serine hydrolase [Elusimicrobiota bacterium]
MKNPLARIAAAGAGYKAKVLASAVFVSGREPEAVLAEDTRLDAYLILRLFSADVDREARSAEARFLGAFMPRTALVRPGLGAALAWGDPPAVSGPASLERPAPPKEDFAALSAPALEPIVADAFTEPNPARLRRTRAIVILKDGKLAAERYAAPFTSATPLAGWSMTKSVLGALVGAAVERGLMRLEDRDLLPEWSQDARRDISVADLLRMRSGLAFGEVYADPLSDVVQMLFAEPDAAAFAAARPLAHPPGTVWKYSSGTTNILSAVLRRALARQGVDYHSFAREALFSPLGMSSAVLETDAAGTFVGSSFMYATARDWARFGLYAAQDSPWMREARTPTPQSPDGRYGAHWWLKLSPELGGDEGLPADAFHALGHEGQCLTVVPSRELVVVRLGLSIYIDAWDHNAFLRRVLAAA